MRRNIKKKNGLSIEDNDKIIELVKAKIRPMHRSVFIW